MSQKKNQASGRQRSNGVGWMLLAAAVLAVVFYVMGGVKVHKLDAGARAEIAQNVQKLTEIENMPVADLEAELRARKLAERQARKGIMVDDLEAEKQFIMTNTQWNKADLQRWFNDAAVVGDSVTIGASNYQWLGAPPVYAEVGIRASDELAMLDDIERDAPSVIFLCFGRNDLAVYRSRVNIYIERYSACIRRLQASIPDVLIYVNAIFPVSQEALEEDAFYGYIGMYNEALQKMCDDLGVFYVDSGFIIERNPSYLNEEGRHMIRDFYPLWLTYLADISGLSNDAE